MIETKTMYHVEKFLPPDCPKCRTVFQQDGIDYVHLLGDIIDGRKQVRETTGYLIIICQHCQNYTACLPLESYQVSDRSTAEELCLDKGFVNLVEVRSRGNHCRDHHAIHMEMRGLRVEGIRCDEPVED
jgi:hypothetical protein